MGSIDRKGKHSNDLIGLNKTCVIQRILYLKACYTLIIGKSYLPTITLDHSLTGV